MSDRQPNSFDEIRRQMRSDPKIKEYEERRQKQKERERRQFLGGTLAVGVLAAAATANFTQNYFRTESRRRTFAEIDRHEGQEHAPSEQFSESVSSFRAVYGSMYKDQVLFVDQFGKAIGEPLIVPSEVFVPDPERPGKTRISQAWLDLQRLTLCRNTNILCDTSRDWPRQLNVIAHLKGEALDTHYVDLVARNGRMPVTRTEEEIQRNEPILNRMKFSHERVGETMSIDNAIIKGEIVRMVPALIGHESTYSDQVTSESGASSSVQAMAETMEHLGYTADELKDFRTQVKFVGDAFENFYITLRDEAAISLNNIRDRYFGGVANQDEFDRCFFAPMLLNSYNAGPTRMKWVLEWFLAKYPNRSAYEAAHGAREGSYGEDLFLLMTQECYFTGEVDGYGPDAALYWVGIEGLAAEMKEQNLY